MGKSIESALAALALLALAAGGCARRGTTTDAGTDASADAGDDAGADAGTDAGSDFWDALWGLPCTAAIATPCPEAPEDFPYPSPYTPVFDIAALGLTAVHSAQSPTVLLAERETDSGTEPVVVAWDWSYGDFGTAVVVGLADPPAEPMRAVDLATLPQLLYLEDGGLTATGSAFGYAAIALLCGASSCALYGLTTNADGEPTGLEPLPGGAVPLTAAHAFAGSPGAVGEGGWWDAFARFCVAGDGIACFDGAEWTEELPAGGAALRAIVAVADAEGVAPYWVAAGDGGRVVTDRGGAWQEIATGVATDLVTVSAQGSLYAAGGPGGFVYGDGEHTVQCAAENTFFAMFVHVFNGGWSGQGISALAEDRVVELYLDETGAGACFRATPFAGVPLDADDGPFFPDGAEGHALTTGAVYRRTEQDAGGY